MGIRTVGQNGAASGQQICRTTRRRGGQLSESSCRVRRREQVGWDGNVECSAYRTNSHTNRSLTLHRVTPARLRTQSACHPVSADSNRHSP